MDKKSRYVEAEKEAERELEKKGRYSQKDLSDLTDKKANEKITRR